MFGRSLVIPVSNPTDPRKYPGVQLADRLTRKNPSGLKPIWWVSNNTARKIGHSKGFKEAISALFLTEFWTLNWGPIGQTLGMAGLPSCWWAWTQLLVAKTIIYQDNGPTFLSGLSKGLNEILLLLWLGVHRYFAKPGSFDPKFWHRSLLSRCVRFTSDPWTVLPQLSVRDYLLVYIIESLYKYFLWVNILLYHRTPLLRIY